MSPDARPRISREAVAGCVLGVASVALCLNVFAGIPAIVLGVRSLLRIEREGPENLRGRGLAMWAFALGSLGTLMGPMLLLPAVQAIRQEMRREEVVANMKQLGAALDAYQARELEAGPPANSEGNRLASPPALP